MGNSIYFKKDSTEFFPTIDWVKDLLYSLMSGDEKTILDPCCGDGGLEYFGKYDYKLIDIENRGIKGVEIANFLKREPEENEWYDCAVINPPFGLTDEFIKQAFKYTDDIYLIAPLKSVLKKWDAYIVDYIFDWELPRTFGILTSVGLFHLSSKRKAFGAKRSVQREVYSKELPVKDTWESIFFETDTAPDKWFIVNRLTKARVLRGEELIKDSDIYPPNDDSAFFANRGNTNVKAGNRIKRFICTFDSEEEAKKFQKRYKEKEEEVREYCYIFGNNILLLKKIPLVN